MVAYAAGKSGVDIVPEATSSRPYPTPGASQQASKAGAEETVVTTYVGGAVPRVKLADLRWIQIGCGLVGGLMGMSWIVL